jgi:DNA-binding MarR family transcriptional regulator
MTTKSTTSPEDAISRGDLSGLTTYQAGVAQAAIHRTLQKYCDEVLVQYGITKMHWLIIGTVMDAGDRGARLTDLSTALGTTLPYLTNAVNLLESKGMLVRASSDTDSRSKLITIHPDFAPKCAVIEATLRDALRTSIYAEIDPAEFRIYMKVLFQLGRVR